MLNPEIISEIRNHLLESADLSKAQCLEFWDLDDDDYKALQFALRNDSGIVTGPQHTGGFRAKAFRQRAAESEIPAVGSDVLLVQAWEQQVVARLIDILSHQELEDLLGEVRQSLRYELGKRRGTKHELAAALVVRHGLDLLADKAVRSVIGRRCDIDPPGSWHSGKHAAHAFVRAISFPACMAGEPAEPPLPDFVTLRGHLPFPDLQDFQREVSIKMLARLSGAGGRAILTLPTGAGKTRVAVETIRDWLGDPSRYRESEGRNAVLWLAHTEELCEQAHKGFRELWESSQRATPATLVRFWGDYASSADQLNELVRALDDTCIVISTPGRVISLIRAGGQPRLEKRISERLGLVVVDEAHRAGAPSYQEILERYGHGCTRVIGLTATPFRLEYVQSSPDKGTRELIQVFRELIEARTTLGCEPRQALQVRKVLATPNVEVVRTSTRFRIPTWAQKDELSPEEEERLDHAMAGRADNSRRRTEILARLLPMSQQEGNSILYFGPTVQDAESMCFMLRRNGIKSAVVSGHTRPAARRALVEAFRRGEIPVLCNCQVLTTGFDAPRVTHVVIGRPTVSRVLFEQMVGRGLRGPAFGGTETCEILIFRDEITGNGPHLGYEEFRELWEADTRRNDCRPAIETPWNPKPSSWVMNAGHQTLLRD